MIPTKSYIKTQTTQMRPWVEGEDLTGASVNQRDTPCEGGGDSTRVDRVIAGFPRAMALGVDRLSLMMPPRCHPAPGRVPSRRPGPPVPAARSTRSSSAPRIPRIRLDCPCRLDSVRCRPRLS